MLFEIKKILCLDTIGQQQWELLLRLVVSCLMGMAIGFERKNRNKIAGVRTHVIVAFGATLMMIVSKYGFGDIEGTYDASRIASQIVTGVGFLGTGVIFVKDKNSVSGLTTAAGIWATSGVGMCIGAGLYFISVSGTIILIIMQEILHRVGFLSNENCHTNIRLMIENYVDVKDITEIIENCGMNVLEINMIHSDKENTEIEMELVYVPKYDKIKMFNKLINKDGIIYLEEK